MCKDCDSSVQAKRQREGEETASWPMQHRELFRLLFEKGGDGGGPSECDNQYHSDNIPIVTLSTGWFNHRQRCFNNITIHGNGRSVVAIVVDECDSTAGCDNEHDYQPHVLTTLWMPRKLFGRPWVCLRVILISHVLVVLIASVVGGVGLRVEAQACKPSGTVRGKKPTSGYCVEDNVCCIPGRLYTTYKCSPPETRRTKAILTINSFEKGGDGNAPAKCDGHYHSDDTPIVALSTGWFNHKKRCFNNITIIGNGRRAVAMVVDERDSSSGCDKEHDYLPPYINNMVDASKAVWKALDVPLNDWGELDIVWSDA
ncbi:hypothetical protein Sjap_020855 [Stephania japonica]|uniref:Ripening-related protein 1 n=1 Tax=Stephania japonica TaxID=461633 RepID=A0AAP0F2P1_9MAGN